MYTAAFPVTTLRSQRSAFFVISLVFHLYGESEEVGGQTNAFQSVTDFSFSHAVDENRRRGWEKGRIIVCVERQSRGWEKFSGHRRVMVLRDTYISLWLHAERGFRLPVDSRGLQKSGFTQIFTFQLYFQR